MENDHVYPFTEFEALKAFFYELQTLRLAAHGI